MRPQCGEIIKIPEVVRTDKYLYDVHVVYVTFLCIAGCQAAVVQIDLKKQTCYSHSLKGITKINNIYFNQDGSIRTWRAYGIGDGTFLSKEEVSMMSPTKQSETGLIILEDLKQPDSTEGSVRNTVVASSDNGWALRKDRKINRFFEKVKTFLRGIFEAGQGGKKVNPMDAANHMRVCMDEDVSAK
ncbi:uncharacterized protein LOC110447815 [Mizuhopecten yessoensis]|uniref:uncharacterized protein LOC110447815 n=1 Tax=Mizuhopecten yessoensis TaxID=6573 RepID=UPI000B459C3D|nr:uncharacterized protein LOC110447815 [Mizuhopecten yessoensis]